MNLTLNEIKDYLDSNPNYILGFNETVSSFLIIGDYTNVFITSFMKSRIIRLYNQEIIVFCRNKKIDIILS